MTVPAPETDPSPSVWRYVRASRAHVVIDAAAYFSLMQHAMLEAKQRIHMIGWDFDTRVRLGPGRKFYNLPDRGVQPARLGAFVIWLVQRTKGLEVRVLKWNFGALKFIFRGSMIVDLIRWWFSPGIAFKFDSAHPLGCSHHQKIIVIDDKFAVCAGQVKARFQNASLRQGLELARHKAIGHFGVAVIEHEAAANNF